MRANEWLTLNNKSSLFLWEIVLVELKKLDPNCITTVCGSFGRDWCSCGIFVLFWVNKM